MINRLNSRVRTPVRRPGAETYLLLTLLSFAASVGLTRLFLALTGYPQLGGGGLHIAHVLWGGLALFVAALLPLIFANRWAYSASAILSGVGVGLFIDEVGKFITANNDYFFPAAAPIIYVFFLMTVLVYLQVRRPRRQNPRAELYCALEELEEVLDHDLDEGERNALQVRLQAIAGQDTSPQLSRLATELCEFLTSDSVEIVPDRPTLYERWQAFLRRLESRSVDQRRVRTGLTIALISLGVVAFMRLGILLSTSVTSATFFETLSDMAASGLVSSSGGIYWFFGRILLEGIVGLMLIAGGVLLIINKEQIALALAFYSLLLSLTVVNLFIFYYDQFSTITLALIQFGVLLTLIYYRHKFAKDN